MALCGAQWVCKLLKQHTCMVLLLQETRAGAITEKTVVMEPAGGVGEVKTEVVAVKKKK